MQNWPMLLRENDEGRGGKRLGYPWVLSFLNTMGRGQGSAGGQPRRGLGLGITGSPHTVHQQLLVQNLPLSAQPLRYKATFEGASVAVRFQVSIQQRLENASVIPQTCTKAGGGCEPTQRHEDNGPR